MRGDVGRTDKIRRIQPEALTGDSSGDKGSLSLSLAHILSKFFPGIFFFFFLSKHEVFF